MKKILYFFILFNVLSFWAAGQVDFRKETIYFLLTTRFFDGDPTNNRPTEWCSYDPNHVNNTAITDPNDVTLRGDFKGLIQKLDYIQDLGFTAIWITPIVENRSPLDYHGYHAWDFTKVDPRLESPGATFQDLINAVHARGMKIVLDIVTNHSGRYGIKNQSELKYNTDPTQTWGKNSAGGTLADNPNWQYDGMTPNPDDGKIWSRANLAKMPSPYNANLANYNWPSTESFVNTSDANWFHHSGNGFVQGWDDTLNLYERAIASDCPDLNTGSQTVQDYLVNAYATFINMGVDALRWDTMKHMNKKDVLSFLDRWKAINPNLFVFGEVAQKRFELHPVQEINPHWYTWRGDVGSSANSNIAVLDFYAEATFHTTFQDGANFSSVKDAARYDNLYSDPSTLLTWLDNHDFGPNNDWNQRFGGTDQNLAACMNFMFTWRGIPVVYYGTENRFQAGVYTDIMSSAATQQSIDLTGRAYFGSQFATAPNHVIYQHIKKLNAMRKAIPALQNGTWTWAGTSDGNGVGYTRKSGTSEVAVGLAKDGAVTFNFTGLTNGTYRDAVTGNTATVSNGSLSFTVQPASAGIYVLNGPGIIGGNGVGFFQAGSGVSTPVATISPAAGNYTSPIQVTIAQSGGTGTTTIYYTTDGTTPTTSSTVYSSAITVSSAMTVKAIAVASNGTSAVASNTYTFGTVSSFSVHFKAPSTWGTTRKMYNWSAQPSGVLADGVWPGVAMTAESNSWYGYTFTGITSTNLIFNDGTNQTADLARNKNGWYTNSTWYDSNPDVANTAPVVTVSPAGPYTTTSAFTVTISGTDDSGILPKLYYTTDGSTPTTTSGNATGSKVLTVSGSLTLKVFAVDNLGLSSTVLSNVYTITPAVTVNSAPIVTVNPAGPYSSSAAFIVTISGTDDSGVSPKLYYTTDGSTPTTASGSAIGSMVLTVSGSLTLKVFAVDNLGLSSAVISNVYTISPPSTVSGFTVYFQKPTAWASTIKIYYWNTLPAGVLTTTAWPGLTMTADGTNWYKYTFANITSTSIIFDDGSNQTADLTRNKNGWYMNGAWYDSDPRITTTTTGLTVHLYTTWATPKLYFWNIQPAGVTTVPGWPGVPMISEGSNWYYYTIPNVTCTSLIFSNNGSSQTADLSRCGEGWYMNSTWYSAKPSARVGIEDNEDELKGLSLDQNQPNPFSAATTISFTLPCSTVVDLNVHSLYGKEVTIFSGKSFDKGTYQVEFERGTLASGVYVYILNAGNKSLYKKFVVE